MKRSTVSGLLAVCLIVSGGAVAQPTVQAGFSPEGSALQLVLNTIDTAQESIRLMGYSFTSPEVTRALIQAKQFVLQPLVRLPIYYRFWRVVIIFIHYTG